MVNFDIFIVISELLFTCIAIIIDYTKLKLITYTYILIG